MAKIRSTHLPARHWTIGFVEFLTRRAIWLVLWLQMCPSYCQNAPVAPDHYWHPPAEQEIVADSQRLWNHSFQIDASKTYSLAELIDVAEGQNPQTRVAWERARSQAAALGIARSDLYPTLVAVAMSQLNRAEILFGTTFWSQTLETLQASMELNYTILDFGARAGRITAARAEVLAADFGFNDTHRNVIYQVEQAYYQLLNSKGQEAAARASLANAQAVQQAAEDRLKNGLATLPDVLEAGSATAQAEFELQSVLGVEAIAQGNLATVLGTAPTMVIHVQPLDELSIPQAISDSVDQAIDRALSQRPDLLQQVAEIRSTNAKVKEARAAFYPTLNLTAAPSGQYLYGSQQTLSWIHTGTFAGGVALSLNWTVFDGGARRSNLARAEANEKAAKAQAQVAHDQIADQVWTAYSNLNTAFRQRQAATSLLDAASQSYAAALESYNYGLRSLLDVTQAQRTLAEARSTDILARTQVLGALADLAYRTGDSIQGGARRP
jgi:outer membrane protein